MKKVKLAIMNCRKKQLLEKGNVTCGIYLNIILQISKIILSYYWEARKVHVPWVEVVASKSNKSLYSIIGINKSSLMGEEGSQKLVSLRYDLEYKGIDKMK